MFIKYASSATKFIQMMAQIMVDHSSILPSRWDHIWAFTLSDDKVPVCNFYVYATQLNITGSHYFNATFTTHHQRVCDVPGTASTFGHLTFR